MSQKYFFNGLKAETGLPVPVPRAAHLTMHVGASVSASIFHEVMDTQPPCFSYSDDPLPHFPIYF